MKWSNHSSKVPSPYTYAKNKSMWLPILSMAETSWNPASKLLQCNETFCGPASPAVKIRQLLMPPTLGLPFALSDPPQHRNPILSWQTSCYLEIFRPYSSTNLGSDEYLEKSFKFNPDSLFLIFSIIVPISALIPCDFEFALVYAVLLQNDTTSTIPMSCERLLKVRPLYGAGGAGWIFRLNALTSRESSSFASQVSRCASVALALQRVFGDWRILDQQSMDSNAYSKALCLFRRMVSGLH